MADKALERRQAFLESLEKLFEDIKQWIRDLGWVVDQTTTPINEPTTGNYDAPQLIIMDKDRNLVAELRPVGANIIGADWRVDMVGPYDEEVLVYWISGAPEIERKNRNELAHKVTRLFKGADKPGWYLIEDTKLGRARSLNKELFIDLLEEVSHP